jgi:hypothetical protein
MVEKRTKAKGKYYLCANEECGYEYRKNGGQDGGGGD